VTYVRTYSHQIADVFHVKFDFIWTSLYLKFDIEVDTMFFRSFGSGVETGLILIWSLIRIGLDTDLGPDRSSETFFDGAKIFQKLDRVAAIVFVQESSKSEPSSRFLSRLKFEKSTRHFWANSADRPGICANLIRIRPNPGTIGWIRQKVASEILKFWSSIGGVILIWWYDDMIMIIWWYDHIKSGPVLIWSLIWDRMI